MKIYTKYSCGNKVFKIQQQFKTEFVKCNFCGGEKRIKGKNGSVAPCPTCHGHGGANVTLGKEWMIAGTMTIGEVRFSYTGKSGGLDLDSIFSNYGPQDEKYEEVYMCYETGIGSGSVHYADTLFPTEETACAECKKRNTPMTTSLEDHAAMRLAGESTVCLCDEYSSLVLSQVEEIKRLKKKIKEIRLPLFLMEELRQGRSNL